MKLYTEEQLHKLIIRYRQNLTEFSLDKPTTQHLIDELTPIELPSDGEIEAEASDFNKKYRATTYEKSAYVIGAKWMREQLKNKL